MSSRASRRRKFAAVLVDEIPRRQKQLRAGRLRTVFKRYVLLALVSHLFLISLTVLYAIVWHSSGYTAVLLFRIPNVLRAVLLVGVLFTRINVLSVMGVGRYYKIVRHFKRYTVLGLWLVVGFADVYLLRWFTMPLLDVLHFTLRGPINTLQFPAYVLLDVLYIGDFYLTLHWVYYAGVRGNIMRNLQSPASRSLLEV